MERIWDKSKDIQTSALLCSEVDAGFTDWVKILLNLDKKFQSYPERMRCHISPHEKNCLEVSRRVMSLLTHNNVEEALVVFRSETKGNTSKVWH
jgi:hypothetical protein